MGCYNGICFLFNNGFIFVLLIVSKVVFFINNLGFIIVILSFVLFFLLLINILII